MRILADSNIFIDFWRASNQEMIDIFSREDVVICGLVKSELMHGARSESDLVAICDSLSDFETLLFEDSDWEILGNHLYLLRKNGITVPFQDAVLATLALKNDIPIWTKDKHFSYMQRVLHDLLLYTSGQ